jgi:hypothetical protein
MKNLILVGLLMFTVGGCAKLKSSNTSTKSSGVEDLKVSKEELQGTPGNFYGNWKSTCKLVVQSLTKACTVTIAVTATGADISEVVNLTLEDGQASTEKMQQTISGNDLLLSGAKHGAIGAKAVQIEMGGLPGHAATETMLAKLTAADAMSFKWTFADPAPQNPNFTVYGSVTRQ